AISQVVGLALWNRVCAAVAGRDARRMLPRAGAGATAGGAIAGLGAGALVYRLGLGVLPILGALVTAVVIALAFAQARALKVGGAPGQMAPPGTPEGLNPLHRRVLRAMIVVALLEGIVGTIIDLQFVSELKRRYGTDPDTLAVAVSLFYGGTNAILLLLQATAVPRLLVTRSLPTTAGIHPAIVILSYIGFAALPGFIALAATRTSDQVLRLATSRTAQEVSLSALPPAPRARWKVLLRGAIGPAGAALAAVVLFLVGPSALAHPTALAGAAIAIAIVWAIAAQIAARRFQAALAAPLGITQVKLDDPSRIDLATLERWTHAAGDDDARTAGLARAALARARVDATDLADHLRHDEPAVRAALFDQLARRPTPALRGELRAAVQIEDDERALVFGMKALALAGDDGGLERGRSAAVLSREVAEAVQSAERTLLGGDVAGELERLLARDPSWAVALIRADFARPARTVNDPELTAILTRAAEDPARRDGALFAIARVGTTESVPVLDGGLVAGAPHALAAIDDLGVAGADHVRRMLPLLSPIARLAIARTLAGTNAEPELIGALVADQDPEVASAALRTALAVARGGGTIPGLPIAKAYGAAFTALEVHLDRRDDIARGDEYARRWSPCGRHELQLATQNCVARVMWASAVYLAAGGGDPAPLAATARRLIGGREPDRRRALDVVQELLSGNKEILALLEAWLNPSLPRARKKYVAYVGDAWLDRIATGEIKKLEPILEALRKPALFATVAGPALAALAARVTRRTITGSLFAADAPGDTMYVVVSGTLLAHRDPDPPRRVEAGGVVGELAVLAHAPRAASVSAEGTAEVIEIDRETFAAAARRSPELVLGLASTLAGWLAPNRPDVL
ncbi:MAG TPA: cyclic nucleotide-binding domain-containing protein, partial [Kofleriaceae bacterium]